MLLSHTDAYVVKALGPHATCCSCVGCNKPYVCVIHYASRVASKQTHFGALLQRVDGLGPKSHTVFQEGEFSYISFIYKRNVSEKMYGMNNNSGCRSVPQFTSLSLIWKNEIIPHGFSWVLNEFIVWILCICSIIFIRTKQNNNNKTQKCVTSLSDLKCGSRTEIQNKSIPFEMLWSHSFSCLTGLFFHMIRLFIAFDKQAGKFQWIVIATLWSDITYLTFTNIRVCVCKYKYRFMYIYICINMCDICVWHRLLLDGLGKMASLYCFQKSGHF